MPTEVAPEQSQLVQYCDKIGQQLHEQLRTARSHIHPQAAVTVLLQVTQRLHTCPTYGAYISGNMQAFQLGTTHKLRGKGTW